jgi:putative CRISPR-associated protein (TIGR02619 family)
MNKFIITCGTSQLGEPNLKNLDNAVWDNYHEEEFKDYFDKDASWGQIQFETWVETHFLPKFRERFEINSITKKLIGTKDNPLGAELSTLHLLQQPKQGIQWAPKDDLIVLLSSETTKGLATAELIRSLLTINYDVPENFVQVVTIPFLNEAPADVDKALDNLAIALLTHIDLDDPRSEIDKYCLVMSGGFKSAIPCLTLTSFFFGIELIYLFENSNEPQHLQPKINLISKKSRQIWYSTWKELAKQGLENQPKYYATLLQGRIDHPDRVFY